MFIVQPTSRLGDLLCEELRAQCAGQRHWQAFEFAVAWVNLAGVETILESAQEFLAAGGRIRATVGLDFSSTSCEGLGCLLDLEVGTADITTHVFFDENRACTFHPKVFMFDNEIDASLFVGSNNMTGAGFGTNVEAAVRVTGASGDEAMRVARRMLAAWRNERGDSRTRRLTRAFLDLLHERGYVRTEEDIRRRRKSETPTVGEPLFGRSAASARGTGSMARGGGGTARSAGGRSRRDDMLIMRVRPRRNGRQLQISMRVHKSSFMQGVTEVVSAVGGIPRRIGYDHVTRGGKRVRNLARFEAPELEGVSNPVVRFTWVGDGAPGASTGKCLQYEVFDAESSKEGAQIFRILEDGIDDPPETDLRALSRTMTVLSKSNREIAQWYRLHVT